MAAGLGTGDATRDSVFLRLRKMPCLVARVILTQLKGKRTTGSGRPPNTKAEGWEDSAENANQQAPPFPHVRSLAAETFAGESGYQAGAYSSTNRA